MKKKRRGAGLTRRRSLRVSQRDEGLLPRIQHLKAEHPFWGYRRIWAYLRSVEPCSVTKKRIWRLMQEHQLVVRPNTQLKAKPTASGSKPRPPKPHEWWGLDMTKVLGEGFGWGSVVLVLDW
jgi:putative transposase